ncbi:MAG: hypothetical protein ACOH2Q_02000 [Rhodococcus sp. (in: high G+C Gram-positive bacteria)]
MPDNSNNDNSNNSEHPLRKVIGTQGDGGWIGRFLRRRKGGTPPAPGKDRDA